MFDSTDKSTGNGVTELLTACAFNSIANGVGPFSFTHVLISQLQKLVHMPAFSDGYNLLFAEIQNWRLENSQHKKAPIHLVLTQDHRLPRSITLSAKRSIPQSVFHLHVVYFPTPIIIVSPRAFYNVLEAQLQPSCSIYWSRGHLWQGF